jgi:uncharacterized OB-fold protein
MTPTPYLPAEMARVDSDDTNRGFYDACRAHQLTIQHCRQCGQFQHPPRALCSKCHSFDLEWAPVSGGGTVFSYTIVHHPIGPVADRVPYNIVTVELEGTGGARLISNVIDASPDEVEIGMPVEVSWDDVAGELTLPRFVRAGH